MEYTLDFASILKLWRVKSFKKIQNEMKIVATCKIKLGLLKHLVFGGHEVYLKLVKISWISNLICKHLICHNPSFGFTTKAKVCKGASQEWNPRVTFHAPGNVGECEGMNLHTPKWAPTLGVRVPMDLWIFKERLQGSKPIGLKSFLYH
jgi:hypothetical protein